MTGMQELLIAFFFKQFAYYGSKVLPVCFKGNHLTQNSNEYGEEVLTQFTAKPDDYEFLLMKQLAGQKHCNEYHDTTPPTQYANTHRSLGLSSGPIPLEAVAAISEEVQ